MKAESTNVYIYFWSLAEAAVAEPLELLAVLLRLVFISLTVLVFAATLGAATAVREGLRERVFAWISGHEWPPKS